MGGSFFDVEMSSQQEARNHHGDTMKDEYDLNRRAEDNAIGRHQLN